MTGFGINSERLAAYTAHLRQEERSAGTVENHLRRIRAFAKRLDGRPVTKELAAEWKEYLLARSCAPVTINSMRAAINGLFHVLGRDACRMKFLKLSTAWSGRTAGN